MDLLPSLGKALVPQLQYGSFQGGQVVPFSQPQIIQASRVPPSFQSEPVVAAFRPERSIEELRSILEAKDFELGDLQEHIGFLKQEPLELEEKLNRLEEQFGQLRPGQTVRLKAPAFHSIVQAVKEDDSFLHKKALEHEKAIADAKLGNASGDATNYDAETGYMKATSLKLGRGCMWLDQDYLNKIELLKKESETHHAPHPLVSRFHYSGHVSRPLEVVEPVFVTARGESKRDIKGASRGGFWLDCFDPKLSETHQAAPTEPLGEFSVTLNRTAGATLGLSVHVSLQESIFIESVGKGIVAQWNAANANARPPQAIKPGDRIIIVNGKRGDAQAMLDELSTVGPDDQQSPYGNAPAGRPLKLTLFREDPTIQYVTRHDEVGQGADHFPVDWLGQLKSGEPEAELRRRVPRLESIAAWLA